MAKIISNQEAVPAKRISAEIAADVKIVIEKFPRIGNRIVLLWGTPDLQNYLNTLIVDERGGRAGFPPPIASAILRIHSEHALIVSKGNFKNEVQF
jgi:hypothetical protein